MKKSSSFRLRRFAPASHDARHDLGGQSRNLSRILAVLLGLVDHGRDEVTELSGHQVCRGHSLRLPFCAAHPDPTSEHFSGQTRSEQGRGLRSLPPRRNATVEAFSRVSGSRAARTRRRNPRCGFWHVRCLRPRVCTHGGSHARLIHRHAHPHLAPPRNEEHDARCEWKGGIAPQRLLAGVPLLQRGVMAMKKKPARSVFRHSRRPGR